MSIIGTEVVLHPLTSKAKNLLIVTCQGKKNDIVAFLKYRNLSEFIRERNMVLFMLIFKLNKLLLSYFSYRDSCLAGIDSVLYGCSLHLPIAYQRTKLESYTSGNNICSIASHKAI